MNYLQSQQATCPRVAVDLRATIIPTRGRSEIGRYQIPIFKD